jgi:hypothetical protein
MAYEARGAGSALRTKQVKVQVKAEYQFDSRRGERKDRKVVVGTEDVLEIEFSDGQRLWVNGATFDQSYAEQLSIDANQVSLRVAAGGGSETRGVASWAWRSLKVLGIEPIDGAAEGAAKIAAGFIEDRVPEGELRQIRLRGELSFPSAGEVTPPVAKRPILVLIHGTASSTSWSFGDLWAPKQSDALRALRDVYGTNAYSFEHHSLTRDPIENAIDLANALASFPAGSEIHLLTHSRGGLIGELLCRLEQSREALFTSEERALFNAKKSEGGTGLPAPAPTALDELEAALKTLKKNEIGIRRFVRVACPTLGTTLASRRLDRWLSVIANIAGLALEGTPLSDFYEPFSDFLAAVLKERCDPEDFPGLAAMMPGSPLIALINSPLTPLDADLTVIAGDIEPDAWWQKLLTFVADRFYDGDHDLVVNTPSMLGGAPRTAAIASSEGTAAATPAIAMPRARLSEHRGSAVNHFHYFVNPDSLRQVVRGLLRAEDDEVGFTRLKPAKSPARAVYRKPGPAQPYVVLLPGTMASELSVEGERIWLDVGRLFAGGFGKLAWGARVSPTRVVDEAYGDIIEYLARSHVVVPFPYDWRLPVEVEAGRLADQLLSVLDVAEREGQPIRLLAHSMGGLVARTMIERRPDVWQRVARHPGARLVMLGTQTLGSHATAALLVGRSRILEKLTLLDTKREKKELLEIIVRFPGVLSLLPDDTRFDFFRLETWQKDLPRKDPVHPNGAELEACSAWRKALRAAPIDRERMIYVAGCADATPAEFAVENGEIKVRATRRGDGRVTWDSGIPRGMPVWYMDAAHGDLANHRPSFEALVELLSRGTTTLLPSEPPADRAVEPSLFPAPPPVEENFPDEEGLVVAALGGGMRAAPKASRARRATRVSILHGDLRAARHPVLVGHYEGDVIASAEAALDSMLDGRLTRSLQLRLYPGVEDTSEVFLKAGTGESRRGAVVVGLGKVGELTAGKLARVVTRAILSYATACLGNGAPGSDSERVLGLSTLLIGTNAGGIGVADSLYGILDGVRRANVRLAESNVAVNVGHVEFVELWQDRALLAQDHFKVLMNNPDLKQAFGFETTLRTDESGRRRLWFDESLVGWWQRLQILGEPSQEVPDGSLRFTAVTQRARSEFRLQPTQRALVDQFIRGAIGSTVYAAEISRTLYELLIPNALKDRAPDRADLVLLLDESAAAYPWELLEDRSSADAKPLAVERGIVRQLATARPREKVRTSTRNGALVIGDPKSSFVELPAAQSEAKAVWRALRGKRFDADQLIRESAPSIVRALYAKEYRVLHLAGHGVYRYQTTENVPVFEVKHQDGTSTLEPLKFTSALKVGERLVPTPPELASAVPCDCKTEQTVTGMVLGDGIFLTAAEVDQMRQVPELVFINCCFLGRLPGASEKALNHRDDYHELAANLASQFIDMGVHAVIAAGWAVDDGAAETFSGRFYSAMLDGRSFGDAVKEARRATFDAHPGSNTFGAYQCYGDPGYVLVRDGDSRSSRLQTEFYSADHAIRVIEDRKLSILRGAATDEPLKDLEQIAEKLQATDWLGRAEVASELASAFAAATQPERAVALYKSALASRDGMARLRDLEALIDILCETATDSNLPDEALDLASWLAPLPPVATPKKWFASPQHFKLRARVHERFAELSGEQASHHLKLAKDSYAAALALLEPGVTDPELRIRSLALEWLHPGTPALAIAEVKTALQELQELVDQSAEQNLSSSLVLAHSALLETLFGGADAEAAKSKLGDLYAAARAFATPRELSLPLAFLTFLLTLARTGSAEYAPSVPLLEVVLRRLQGR